MPDFIEGDQHDAGECLQAIVKAMIESQFKFPDLDRVNVDISFMTENSCLTPFGKLFEGITKNQKICLQCKNSVDTLDEFTIFQL